ncbi:hypothetical protein GCM10012275_23590 [Longimycelium tulufanense]|uniref:Uncharacterized protein n=1 Tax=Longimycelium tulufanense TaxID=907463 RepID=A0A8J3C7V2_9PSEU|nr:hypothetical protein [Longimycelium tulufanense]GGM51933.1 hypothetical protein GCM10012275_23590 [Longimycelium tulufanense]
MQLHLAVGEPLILHVMASWGPVAWLLFLLLLRGLVQAYLSLPHAWVFRRFALPIVAKRRGWAYEVEPVGLVKRIPNVVCRISGTYCGYRFEAVQIEESNLNDSTSTRTTLHVNGLGNLPYASIKLNLLTRKVRVHSDPVTKKVIPGSPFEKWLKWNLRHGCTFETGLGFASTKWSSSIYPGKLRRKIRFLARAARRFPDEARVVHPNHERAK